MKRFFYAFVFQSIFCTSYICNAQTGTYTVQICNYPEGNISKTQLTKLAESGCNMIKFYDADGNEVKLKEFVIAAVPANKKNSFWSLETNGKLNPNQKQLLSKLEDGDEFLIQDVVLEESGNTVKLQDPFRFKVMK